MRGIGTKKRYKEGDMKVLKDEERKTYRDAIIWRVAFKQTEWREKGALMTIWWEI